MPHFEVIGDDDEDIEGGDVMGGDVMGYAGPMGDYEGSALVGYDEYGEPIVVGARSGRRLPVRRRRGRTAISVQKPGWRGSQLAPGVIAPDQGMLTLPLQGIPSATFALAVQAITFQGQVQKPFRPERLLVTTVRTGPTAVGRLLANMFVGTDLQQLDVQAVDIEQLGDPAAFGVRLAMKPCQPGVFIRLVTVLSNAIAGADTIFTTIQILGRAVH
jgi:hypothetical protein